MNMFIIMYGVKFEHFSFLKGNDGKDELNQYQSDQL